jgi:hypothetical protein
MTPSPDRPDGDGTDPSSQSGDDAPGLISDEELPEDLQPTDDNPLARDPDADDEGSDGDAASGPGRVDGMPDAGQPGA